MTCLREFTGNGNGVLKCTRDIGILSSNSNVSIREMIYLEVHVF